MDEYLSERERWEALKAWVKENGPWIVGGVAVAALGLAGWRWWEARTESLALEAGARYEQVVQALDRGERQEAQALLEELQREYPGSAYADQARLVAARALVEAGELEAAAERLRDVMQTTEDRELALITRLRLARVQIALGQADAALATLDAVEPGAFAPRFHEVRGDAYYAKGDEEAALEEYRAARAADSLALVNTEVLDLKIGDLLAEGVGRREPATAATSEEVE